MCSMHSRLLLVTRLVYLVCEIWRISQSYHRQNSSNQCCCHDLVNFKKKIWRPRPRPSRLALETKTLTRWSQNWDGRLRPWLNKLWCAWVFETLVSRSQHWHCVCSQYLVINTPFKDMQYLQIAISYIQETVRLWGLEMETKTLATRSWDHDPNLGDQHWDQDFG